MHENIATPQLPRSFRESLTLAFASLGNFFTPPLKITIPNDAEAMASDWRQVGDDLRSAMQTYEKQLHD